SCCLIQHSRYQAVSSLKDNGPLFPRLITATGCNFGESVQITNTPPVHNFSTERDLVITLQVALAVRVTITDHLKTNRLLHTPTDRREITNKRANTRLALLNTKIRNSTRSSGTVILKC